MFLICRKAVLGRRNSKYKSPDVYTLECVCGYKEATAGKEQSKKGREV